MKLENITRVNQLVSQLKSVNDALNDVEEFQLTKTKDNFGYEVSSDKSIYDFHISEYRDGSGLTIDLTNCGVAIDTVKFIKSILECRKSVIITELETL